MTKAPDAFRTISEVAEQLDTPAHVLRFWESKFSQLRPVKRAGGRRYYRPADVALLGGIKKLLHEDGLTIRGVKKVLSDKGVRHVAGLTDIDFGEDAQLDAIDTDELAETAPAEVPDDASAPSAAAVAQPPCPPAPPPPEIPAPAVGPARHREPLPRPMDISGLAARLRRLSATDVASHRQTLAQASERLRALHSRRAAALDAGRS